MSMLEIKTKGSNKGYIKINLCSLSNDSDDIYAKVLIYPVHNNETLEADFTTIGWQVGRIYFEILGRAFVRARDFSETRFPVSYYEDSTFKPSTCSLHIDLEYLHIFLRGLKNQRISITIFLYNYQTHEYAYLNGSISLAEAECFGKEILDELDSMINPPNTKKQIE